MNPQAKQIQEEIEAGLKRIIVSPPTETWGNQEAKELTQVKTCITKEQARELKEYNIDTQSMVTASAKQEAVVAVQQTIAGILFDIGGGEPSTYEWAKKITSLINTTETHRSKTPETFDIQARTFEHKMHELINKYIAETNAIPSYIITNITIAIQINMCQDAMPINSGIMSSGGLYPTCTYTHEGHELTIIVNPLMAAYDNRVLILPESTETSGVLLSITGVTEQNPEKTMGMDIAFGIFGRFKIIGEDYGKKLKTYRLNIIE